MTVLALEEPAHSEPSPAAVFVLPASPRIPLLKKGFRLLPPCWAAATTPDCNRPKRAGSSAGCTTTSGSVVVWLPTAWSIAMAYHAHPERRARRPLRAAIYVPLCFGVKSLGIMTIDDLLDRDIDARVERTKNRPLPRRLSPGRAWLFFGTQAALGVFLAFTTLSTTALRASMPVWPLYIIYPTCKRWTNLAPIPLGLMFNVGVFMGWGDLVAGPVPWRVLVPVYLGCALWTVTYETVYQHQDKIDDSGDRDPLTRASLPRTHPRGLHRGGAGLPRAPGVRRRAEPPGRAVLRRPSAGAGGMLLRALRRTDVDVPGECKEFFLRTPRVGQVVLGGFVADAVLRRVGEGLRL
ncbi:UbiA prenyltransferase [Mycena olivaceomarginata]|nr:UbiA prenyltransferase [Mycena olivaceomarginata]